MNVSSGRKFCVRCEQILPLDAFPVSRKSLDGRGASCQPCRKVASVSEDDLRLRATIARRQKEFEAAVEQAKRFRVEGELLMGIFEQVGYDPGSSADDE